MGDPTSSYATAGIARRVWGALKPHHHDKAETPSVGKRKITVRNVCGIHDLAQGQIYEGATGPLQNRNQIHSFSSDIYFYNIVLFVLLVLTRINKCHNLNFLLLTEAFTFLLPRGPHDCKADPVLAIITCINATLANMRYCSIHFFGIPSRLQNALEFTTPFSLEITCIEPFSVI
jgi:hypothetical protein